MARTDSFFLRQDITLDNNGAFNQETIDLGAVVDALGKTVLRIHNIAVQYSDPTACLLYTSPSPRDGLLSRMPSSA